MREAKHQLGRRDHKAEAPPHRPLHLHQEEETSTFGSEIYRLRVARGLTQIATARLCGLTRGYYSQIENSKRFPPPPETLERFVVALHLTPSEAKALRSRAEAERCNQLQLPIEIPAAVAQLIHELTKRAHSLRAEQLRALRSLITENRPM